MILKYLVPILAAAGVAFAVRTVILAAQVRPVPEPAVEPARAPFDAYIAAAGIVEPSSESIAIAAVVPGVVTHVHVEVGDYVDAGTPLYRTDARQLEATLAVQRAAADAARARVERLESLPRAEDLRQAEAKLVEAEAELSEARDHLALAEAVSDPRAMSVEERNRRRSAVEVARARRDEAQAARDWQLGGAWEPDLAIARAELAQAQAQIASAETEIERTIVRAPIDATVLQVDVRPGEFASAGVLSDPLMQLGATRVLHVRTDIDENDAWRFADSARAIAFLRGHRESSAELTFVRVEPYVVPKRSLTGESTERVDTRVLQVLYRFDPAAMRAYVGQQVDVFVEAPPIASDGAR